MMMRYFNLRILSNLNYFDLAQNEKFMAPKVLFF